MNYARFTDKSIIFFIVTKILVSTGNPLSFATKTEIINPDNESLTCQDLEDYPLGIEGAVGSNIGSFPVICGGWDGSGSVKQCHRLESGRWQHFANLTQGSIYIWFALIIQIDNIFSILFRSAA